MPDDIWSSAFDKSFELSKKEAEFLWESESFTKDLRSVPKNPNVKTTHESTYMTEDTTSFIPMSGNVPIYQFQAELDGEAFDVVGYEYDDDGNPLYEKLQSKMPPPNKEYASIVGTPAIQLKRCMGETKLKIAKKEVENFINPADLMHGDAELSDARLAHQNELFSRSTYFNKSHQQESSNFDTGREMYNGYNLKDPHSKRTNHLDRTHREEDARSVPILANPTIEETIVPSRRVREKQSIPFTRKPMRGTNETSKSNNEVQLKKESAKIKRDQLPYLNSALLTKSMIHISKNDVQSICQNKNGFTETNSENIRPFVTNESNRDLKGKEGNMDNITDGRFISTDIDVLPSQRDEESDKKFPTYQPEVVASISRPEVITSQDDIEVLNITKNINSDASMTRPDVFIGEKDDYENKRKKVKNFERGNRIRIAEDAIPQQRETLNKLENPDVKFVNTANIPVLHTQVETKREEQHEYEKSHFTTEQVNIQSYDKHVGDRENTAVQLSGKLNVGTYVKHDNTEQVEQMREHESSTHMKHLQNVDIRISPKIEETINYRESKASINKAHIDMVSGPKHEYNAIEQMRENSVSTKRNISLPMSNVASVPLCDNLDTLREEEQKALYSFYNSNQVVKAAISVPDRTDAAKIYREKPDIKISGNARPHVRPSIGARTDGKEVPLFKTSLKTIPQIRSNISLNSTAGTMLLPDRMTTLPKQSDKRRDVRTTPTLCSNNDRSTPTRMITGRNTPLVQQRMIPGIDTRTL